MRCPHCKATMDEIDHGICRKCRRHCGCSFNPTSYNDWCKHHRPKGLTAPKFKKTAMRKKTDQEIRREVDTAIAGMDEAMGANPARRKRPKPKEHRSGSLIAQEIEERVTTIRANALSDPEAAQAMRIKLYEFTLRIISLGHPLSYEFARLAHKASKIKLKWEATA